MKEQLFSTLKQSVEILQNHKMTPQELKATEFVKKYSSQFNDDQWFWIEELTKLIGPEIDLDLLAVENEKKNQRIRELEECLRGFERALDKASDEFVPTPIHEAMNKAKQLLNQKP